MGRPFAAILKLAKDDEGHWKMEFDFGQNDDEGDGEPVDFSGETPVGHCPKCNGSVYEHGMKYVCENAVGSEKTCDFTTGKIILQQEISSEQIGKLLSNGKTDLLTGFKSSRTGRNFKAYLVKQPDGKIGFEFEAREPKAGAAAKTAAKTGAAAKAAAKSTGKSEETEAAPVKAAAKKAPAKKAATKATAKSAAKPAGKTAAGKTATAKSAAGKTTAAKKTGSSSRQTAEAEE
jgi:DNA topoisomerase-3